MTETTKTETRRFGMDPNLLMSVIKKQAGTLSKAVLELVMNSIDAGASKVFIEVDHEMVTVTDDGKGFTDRFEIENYFETFGTPHNEGDARYGRFRMGRGQAFAFGANHWQSNHFMMDVDINKNGLDYHLEEYGSKLVDGCKVTISLYDRLTNLDMGTLNRELSEQIKYAEIPVMVNGHQINTLPGDEKWTDEDDVAYYKMDPDLRSLSVYNMGVLVERMAHHEYGIGGTVVAKEGFDVNFARNQIIRKCPVWAKVVNKITDTSKKERKKKVQLTESDRQHLATQWRYGTGDVNVDDILDASLVHTGTGRNNTFNQLMGWDKRDAPFALVPEGHTGAGNAQAQHLLWGITKKTLERFSCATLQEWLQVMAERFADHGHKRAAHFFQTRKIMDPDILATLLASDAELLADGKLVRGDMLILNSLRDVADFMVQDLNISDPAGVYGCHSGLKRAARRKVSLGKSSEALAWTDGKTYIGVQQKHARELKAGYPGAVNLAQTLLHELCHDTADIGSHMHTEEFYKTFHDRAGNEQMLGRAAERMMQVFARRIRSEGLKMSKKLAKQLDDADLAAHLWPEEATDLSAMDD